MSNIIVVIGRIGDLWTFIMFAFNEKVPWDGDKGLPSLNFLIPDDEYSVLYSIKNLLNN